MGGLLFLPLSWEIYDPERATRALRSFCECVRRQHADEDVVVLSEIFPHGQSLHWWGFGGCHFATHNTVSYSTPC